MHPHSHILAILIGSALALLTLSIPLILGIVPRNRWYGVRTPQTMLGTAADWYAINRRGGIALLSLSFAALVTLAGFALLQP